MQLSLDVEGLDDVVRGLRRLEARVAIKEIRAATRYAIKPTIAAAKALVPYDGNEDEDSYSLRDSIKLRAERKKNRGGNAVVFRVGPQRETAGPGDSPGYAIAGGLGKGPRAPNYAQLVEDDTPFLLPAFERTDDELLRRFAERLRRAVEKAGV